MYKKSSNYLKLVTPRSTSTILSSLTIYPLHYEEGPLDRHSVQGHQGHDRLGAAIITWRYPRISKAADRWEHSCWNTSIRVLTAWLKIDQYGYSPRNIKLLMDCTTNESASMGLSDYVISPTHNNIVCYSRLSSKSSRSWFRGHIDAWDAEPCKGRTTRRPLHV